MRKRTLILLGTSFLLFLVAAIVRFVSFQNMREYTHEVEMSRNLIVSLEKLSNHLKSAQIYSADSSRGEDYVFFKKYRDEQAMIPGELEQVTGLVRRFDEKQQALWHVVDLTVRKHLPLLMQKNVNEIAHSEERWRLGALLRINTTITLMVQHEEAALDTKKRQLQQALAWTDGVSFALVLIALLIFGITFTHNLKLSKKERWLEGFLSSVLNTSQAGIVSYKAMRERGRITDFSVAFSNEAVAPLLGMEDARSNQTKQALEQFVKEANLFQHFVTVAETGNKMELETQFGSGAQKQWLQLLLARRDDGVTLSIHNISAIKQYQEDLKISISQLERSNAELEQYAYAASHDLQEPLRKITTFGHLLHDTQTETLDEKGKNYLDKILSSASRMTALIRDLLNFSSLNKRTDFEPVNLQEILDNVLQDLELVIAQKEARIYAEALPSIEAIPLQMHQLFYNLCNNALKFSSPNRKPEIRITCSRTSPAELDKLGLPQGSDYLRLMVADNGIGFDKTHALQIFGLFKRLNNKELYNGSGIGLALCKRVMENHQGLIFAESSEGYGARFYLLLPVSQSNLLTAETTMRNTA
jgi:signal transduction histidine kinase